jgi:hypothetical protein
MPAPAPDLPPTLQDRALEDLSYIRRTMAGAASFTDVPGWGLVLIGSLALGAAFIAGRQPTPERWLLVWLTTAMIAASSGTALMLRKMRRRVRSADAPLLTPPARKFLLAFWPAVIAGAVLTFALVQPGDGAPIAPDRAALLPGLWLLLYGVGVATAGAHSVRPVPLMGLGFLLLGTLTLLAPTFSGDVAMATGFGGLHIAAGLVIARRHGG